jgi:hypothetical protein
VDIFQLLLIGVGLAITAGGGAMVLRGAGRDASGVPRPYIPLGVMAAGIVIAYLAFSGYATMDGLERVGLFLFGAAFAGALLIKLFVTDGLDLEVERGAKTREMKAQGDKAETDAGGSGS